MNSRSSSFILTLDSLGYMGGSVYVLSAAGAETGVKAFRACLAGGTAATFDAICDVTVGRGPCSKGYQRHSPSLMASREGYDFRMTRLGYNTWHLLAIARQAGVMPCLSDNSLNAELRSPRFSTPFLREWMPWLRRRLFDEQLLHLLDGYQTEAAHLSLSSDGFDALVTEGLSGGFITIPQRRDAP